MGDLVARGFSPEEKTAFAAFLEQKRAALPRGDFARFLVPLAERAGLLELAVRWRTELMEANRQNESNEHLRRLVDLQTSRLRFAELAGELERFADSGARVAPDARVSAADAYRKAGDPAGELRMLATIKVTNLPAALLRRYFELLLDREPQRLVTLAGAGARAHPRRRGEFRRRPRDLRSGAGRGARARAGVAARLDHCAHGPGRSALRAIRRRHDQRVHGRARPAHSGRAAETGRQVAAARGRHLVRLQLPVRRVPDVREAAGRRPTTCRRRSNERPRDRTRTWCLPISTGTKAAV